MKLTTRYASLPPKKFNHFTYCHSTWKSMGIHNQIRAYSSLREGEVFLLNNGTTNTFLSMSATEFGIPLDA
ncbi:Os03g0403251 [Oryza sativa Japonica Group]|uniref:Os03g0403251 protein n=1 Tax=Oryza sativa subsp. japonica TaxID=39947 RepID=A0A0P0VZD1_ORYSJ|nr:hypothetical protein EE612_017960 [Oryza sativa]BAS84619.1 Os03g0403251 [Oryza sativa Japonica Group]